MKNKISLALAIIMILSAISLLVSCNDPQKGDEIFATPTINGAKLETYTIVYDFEGLDYNKRAAEYIKNETLKRYNVELAIVDDSSEKQAHEIIVGETSRPISAELNAETQRLQFSILANEGSIALEGDYFVIAAAAYFFMETYASSNGGEVSVSETASVHDPIVKEAKNFILLIGDGMGYYQTKLFEYMEVTCDFSDGEDVFYGYMLPYIGSSRTASLSGITDSAAGGTALACGIKTYNEYLGRDKDFNDVKNMTELAHELGKSAAVMSTEAMTGATPSSFVVHANDRDDSSTIIDGHFAAAEKYGTVITCGYDYYAANYMKVIDKRINETLEEVSKNENGFFLMYEEAHIDKHCHDNDMDKTFQALIRFNQSIARFMEFAFYNPDTFVLITADHETGRLLPDENGMLQYNYDDHSEADVLIFAYGIGAELFNGVNVENIQIAHTIAALMGEENFGDQSVYQSLTKK